MKFFLFILFSIFPMMSLGFDLTIRVKELPSQNGQLLYILFNDDQGFPDDSQKGFRQGAISFEEIQEGWKLKDLPKGKYALSIIHDENQNGKLDTNFMGIPKEAFGFSKNPRILFGPPSFKKARFKLDQNKEIIIKFKTM